MQIIKTPSPNFGARRDDAKPYIIVLHYTGMENAKVALDRMCDEQSEVSAHYMIDEAGAIFQLVDEDKRAWHAGVSSWNGQEDINSHSIGIEMVNRGQDEYPDAQINSVIKLCLDIKSRYEIKCVLGHSDIAPTRKIDPGEQFPWHKLREAGIQRY